MFAELLRARLDGIYELSQRQIERLERHYELLLRWNKVLNLTALRRVEDILEVHYCESIFLAVHLPPGSLKVADVGSGAGFPGFPVAVVRPECSVTLVESHKRKAVFLRESCRALGNVTILANRAEELRIGFDWAISRAVKLAAIQPILFQLGRRVAILTGESDLPTEIWETPVRLPWGKHRFLAVSRETASI